MAGDDDSMVGVGFDGFPHVFGDGLFDFVPGVAEAAVDVAFIAPVDSHPHHVPVGFPVCLGDGAADGEDDEFVCGVDGDVACVVEFFGVFEFGEGGCGGGFDKGAVSRWAG